MKRARSASVVTHLRCNQACLFCTRRSDRDDLRFVQGERVRARVDAGLEGARDVVFTGGEPTMRADLAELVRHARTVGAERVVLETNATLLDAARARELAAAGLALARVHLPGLDAAYDRITRDEGGFATAVRGLESLRDAGVDVELALPLVRSSVTDAATVPGRMRALLGDRLRGVVLGFPVEAADPAELLRFDEAAGATLAVVTAARDVDVAVRMAPGDPLPPCALDRSVPGLYAMTPGAPRRPDHSRVPACEECLARDRCSGIPAPYLARFGEPELHPVKEDRARRRLALAESVDEQIARELVSTSVLSGADGTVVVDETIRVGFRCNQSCTFCFVSTHLPSPRRSDVEAAIRAAASRGSRIVLSGGEPTLDPGLVDWVRLARSLSTRDVVLQTNAVRLDDASLVTALENAGLAEAFVSLHGATAGTSDAITEAPGTFARTVVGVDHLHASTIRVVLNVVVCERNRGELLEHARLVATRWPRASINVSFVAPSSDLVPRDRNLVPCYSEVLPAIGAMVAEARRLGLRVVGFESMCGLPLCLVPPEAGDLAVGALPEGMDGGEFVKPPACAGCAKKDACWGLRRGYVELHGDGEIRPF